MANKPDKYIRPTIRTMEASKIVESLGPVSAGSGTSLSSGTRPDIMPGR